MVVEAGDVVGRLYDAAEDEDLAVLDAVMVRAGLLWRCTGCGSTSREGEQACESCGAPDLAGAVDADSARDLAIEWQTWAGERSLSMGELADWQGRLAVLGERFGLVEEFRENGIC